MNCKICSSKTEKIKDIKKDIYYYKCKECDFVFIDEKNIYSTEDEKVRYLKHNNRFENNGFFIIVTLFHPESIEKFLKWWY